jgi:hypothetical protein
MGVIRNGARLMVAAALLLAMTASSASAAGTWEQYPTGATQYQAQIQQPINSANTSNWSSKSKGGIPVMFKLSSRTSGAAFESIVGDTSAANDYSFISFTPSSTLTFNDITTLKTDYSFTTGNCHGGSLRWSVRLTDNDSDPSNDPAIFIYYGDAPSFTDCTTNSQSGANMIGPNLSYDTSQLGGTFYDSYANALALASGRSVRRGSLALDSGWGGDQRATVSNTTVNGDEYDFVSGGGGGFAPTCTQPDATIYVNKTDGAATGPVSEEPVQSSLVSSGNAFRVIDCKYQYVLSIPSLRGAGTYEVKPLIGGIPVSTGTPVKFDLK